MVKFNKLILVGSDKGAGHIYNYYNLIKDYFDEILVISDSKIDFCNSYVIDFGLRNPISIYRNIKRLRNIIQDFQPSIVHVHQANSFGYITSIANNGKYPQVLTTWGSDVLLLPKKGGFYRYIVKKSLKSSQIITADAVYMKQAINNLIENVDVVIANFGIDTAFTNTLHQTKEKIIYSNRLHNKLYNIDKIILGCATFLKNHNDWKLIIAGNGTETENLKTLAQEHLPSESYQFIGFVSQEINISFYKKSYIYISIPDSDGTSISLLEAMFYGCVPIVSNLPANKEWVKETQNGFIYDNNCTIEDCIHKAINAPHLELANNNFEIINNRASKEVNKKIYISLYQKLLF